MEKKNSFSSGLGFILATAGSSVGLGNLWSFPYKTSQNGGAAFVIVYILSVLLLGLALSVAEIYIGKRSKANNVTAFKKTHKNLGWIGLVTILGTLMIAFYYAVIGGYTIKYTVSSFSSNPIDLKAFSGNTWEVILYSGIFLALTILIISFGVKRGIEKASKILMPALIVILIGIVIYCLCLGSGVKEGLNFYLNPDFKALGAKGILNAMAQAFFSMSIGCGTLCAYGSYTGKEIRIGKCAVWVAVFDTAVALLAGLAIFPAIYHYKAETGIDLDNSGIVLLFSSMPVIFSKLGVAGMIVSFLFFGMVAIAAVTSLVSLIEVIAQYLIQRFHLKRKKACVFIALFVFAVSIPVGMSLGYSLNEQNVMVIGNLNFLEILDQIVTTIFIPLSALFIALCVGWFMFPTKNKKDFFNFRYLSKKLEEEGLSLGKFSNVFAFLIKYVAPLFILVIDIIGLVDRIFPSSRFELGGLLVVLTGVALIGILIGVYFLFLKNKDTGDNAIEDSLKN